MLRSGVSYQVLIVEDSSPDGTMAVALRLQKVFPGKVRVFKRAGKLGLGSAYMDALKFVKSDFVVLMDADMSHHVSPNRSIPVELRRRRALRYARRWCSAAPHAFLFDPVALANAAQGDPRDAEAPARDWLRRRDRN